MKKARKATQARPTLGRREFLRTLGIGTATVAASGPLAGEANLFHRLVGPPLGAGQRVADCGDAEYAAAVRHDPAVLQFGPRVEDLDIG